MTQMKVLERVHGSHVHTRRTRILCGILADMIPEESAVLDVGCGDGLLSMQISETRPDISITGIDVHVRPHTHIPVQEFDGSRIPCVDKSVDVILMVDVLHHADDPVALIRDARRVARQSILIKDHTRNGLFAASRLRFMDWFANTRHGISMPYAYWSQEEWQAAFAELDLSVDLWVRRLHLYPWPAELVFGGSLHFVTRLIPGQPSHNISERSPGPLEEREPDTQAQK